MNAVAPGSAIASSYNLPRSCPNCEARVSRAVALPPHERTLKVMFGHSGADLLGRLNGTNSRVGCGGVDSNPTEPSQFSPPRTHAQFNGRTTRPHFSATPESSHCPTAAENPTSPPRSTRLASTTTRRSRGRPGNSTGTHESIGYRLTRVGSRPLPLLPHARTSATRHGTAIGKRPGPSGRGTPTPGNAAHNHHAASFTLLLLVLLCCV